MNKHPAVLFYLPGYGEITARELIFGIGILAIYIVLGMFIHGKIVASIDKHNLKYMNAYAIQDNDTFRQAYETEQGADVFAYGKLEAVGYVTAEGWVNHYNKNESGMRDAVNQANGKYSVIGIEKEHYTRHTRIVTYAVNGKIRTRTEVYYTWDTVWDKWLHVGRIKFAGIEFPYGTFKFNGCHQVGYNRSGSDRWTIRAYPLECSGITFININNKDVGTDNAIYNKNNTPEDFEALREDMLMGNGWLVFFWIMFITVGVALIFLWAMLDNSWLNNL